MYFPAFFFLCVSVIVMKISSIAYHQHIYQIKELTIPTLSQNNNQTQHSFLSKLLIKFEFISYIFVNYFIYVCIYCKFIIQENEMKEDEYETNLIEN